MFIFIIPNLADYHNILIASDLYGSLYFSITFVTNIFKWLHKKNNFEIVFIYECKSQCNFFVKCKFTCMNGWQIK